MESSILCFKWHSAEKMPLLLILFTEAGGEKVIPLFPGYCPACRLMARTWEAQGCRRSRCFNITLIMMGAGGMMMGKKI